MKNLAFSRALASLLHPLSLGAILLLVWNDHWLRHQYPSWWTGKIGDFAWLVFAPFICAAVLSWLVPRRLTDTPSTVAFLSFLIVGLWFSLAKTIPVAHSLTVTVWEAIVGWKGSQGLDPSDLVTLPALLVGWFIWRQFRNRPLRRAYLGTVALAVGVVATLASDDPTYHYVDSGITSVCIGNSGLVAYVPAGGDYEVDNSGAEKSGYKLVTLTKVFASSDGGQTWQLVKTLQDEGQPPQYDAGDNCSKPQNHLLDMLHPGIQYRWKPGETIERSVDNGQHWTTDYDLPELHQDVRLSLRPSTTYFNETTDTGPGPRSGLIDPATGNVVLAMGWDGVLIRSPVGKWTWSEVGNYHLEDLADPTVTHDVLFFEWWQAAALIVLVLTTSTAFIHADVGRYIVLAVGWLGWLGISAILLPEYHRTDDFLMTGLISLPLLLLALPILIGAAWDSLRNFRRVLPAILGTGIAAAGLYLFPFLLWLKGTVPHYLTALAFALLMCSSVLVAGYSYLRPRLIELRYAVMPRSEAGGQPLPE